VFCRQLSFFAGAQQSSDKADAVSRATETMDANLSSVANASEKAATNVQTVAMAAEEMSATIKGIAANTEKGSMITRQAVKQAQSVTEKVSELGRATKDVGNITTTEEIASNVNHAVDGIQQVNNNAIHGVRVSDTISQDIVEVTKASQEVSRNSS
jgi:methyl-accepting chemotaxis protein